jgi:hypothetical protein
MKMFMTVAALLLFVLPAWTQHHPVQHTRTADHHAHHPAYAPRPGHNVHLPNHVHRSKPIGHTRHDPIPNYHRRHGHEFTPGLWRYRGHNHHHWTYRYWDAHYGANLYWDPGVKCYYYWCAPHNCYYPISYVPLGTYYFEEKPAPEPAVPATPEPPTTCPCGAGCRCPPGCCCHRR